MVFYKAINIVLVYQNSVPSVVLHTDLYSLKLDYNIMSTTLTPYLIQTVLSIKGSVVHIQKLYKPRDIITVHKICLCQA